MNATLYFRHGEAFAGTPHVVEGRPAAILPRTCHRCGGAGGADKWKHTGWTCFECGGRGNLGTKAHRLYTAEKLAKLNAAADKRHAAKTAKLEAAAAAAKAEADARRAAFEAEHGALIARAAGFAERNPFVADVVRKATEKAALTEGQRAALEAAIARIEAEDARKAAATWVGKVGERLTLTVTAVRVTAIETRFGIMRIATMRDAHGNTIVAKGKFVPPTATWTDEDGWKVTAEPFTIKATVKEHGAYREERQTIVERVAEVTR